jgi:membrane-associated HD superfamily phosphohydrolase
MKTKVEYAVEPVKAPRTRAPIKIVIIVCCAVIASMWVYYFVFATNEGVYQVQDKSWRVAAHEICKAASTEREALANTEDGYIAKPTHEQMLQRADIVDQATDILDQMVTDLAAIPVDNDKDATRIEFFVENYRIVLSDRRRYTAGLRTFKLEPYNETAVGGGPVTNVVLDFTAGVKGNDIPECSPPGELGGDVQT